MFGQPQPQSTWSTNHCLFSLISKSSHLPFRNQCVCYRLRGWLNAKIRLHWSKWQWGQSAKEVLNPEKHASRTGTHTLKVREKSQSRYELAPSKHSYVKTLCRLDNLAMNTNACPPTRSLSKFKAAWRAIMRTRWWLRQDLASQNLLTIPTKFQFCFAEMTDVRSQVDEDQSGDRNCKSRIA
jgi:hypothetical protein